MGKQSRRLGVQPADLLRHAAVFVLAALAACSHPGLSPDTAPKTQGIEGHLSVQEIKDGSVFLISVRAPKGAEVTGQFSGIEFPLFPNAEEGEGIYTGVVGVPYEFQPGNSKVVIRVANGPAVKTQEFYFTVLANTYPSEQLKVPPRKVVPLKRDLKRIARETKEVGAVYRTVTRQKYWKGPFVIPIQSDITSVYGTRRVYNGMKTGSHNAVDLRAQIGTDVRASASGVVALAKDLFFTGNTIIIDHGYGVMTLYAHLSKIHVKKGDLVDEKQVIALSGATGRVSGPHLHWSGIIHNVKVDPLTLTEVMR